MAQQIGLRKGESLRYRDLTVTVADIKNGKAYLAPAFAAKEYPWIDELIEGMFCLTKGRRGDILTGD